ncbi:MAG: hypothetical protein ABW217_19790 [Polyangiaceae bacterium]
MLSHVVESAHGPLLVYDWESGELVRTASAARTDPASAFMRFKALPLATLARALSAVFRVHSQVCARGWVACDFYDGALMSHFETHALKLVDLDMYHEGPFINDKGRMFGSDRFMAPEEFELGARIDEKTTVFTMGRCITVFLGERDPRSNPAALLDMLEVGKRACQAEREQRWPSMGEFYEAWLAAIQGLSRATLWPRTRARSTAARRRGSAVRHGLAAAPLARDELAPEILLCRERVVRRAT